MFKALAKILRPSRQEILIQGVDLGALSKIHEIGYQPFILIRIKGWSDRDSWVVCETQNEAPRFVHEIVACGLASQNPIIDAINRALRLETEAAAEILDSWVTECYAGFRVMVMHGLPFREQGRQPLYAGYPIFEIDLSTPSAAAIQNRVDFLARVVDGYASTSGNESLRAALVSAFRLAIERLEH